MHNDDYELSTRPAVPVELTHGDDLSEGDVKHHHDLAISEDSKHFPIGDDYDLETGRGVVETRSQVSRFPTDPRIATNPQPWKG